MSCLLQRDNCNPEHRTCRSYIAQGGECNAKKRTARKTVSPVVVSEFVGKEFQSTQYLYSLNHWHGRPRHVYSDYKKQWRGVLRGTWAIWGKAKGPRDLTVLRMVTAEKNMIKDRDNLVGAMKPIKDLLVEMGVLLDDTDDLVTFDIRQEVGKKQMCYISIKDKE